MLGECSLDARMLLGPTQGQVPANPPSIGSTAITCSQLANSSLQLISFPNKIFLGDRETDHFN